MKKIVLLCASGMSTSMLVKKMQEAAKAENYECEISAYSAATLFCLDRKSVFPKAKLLRSCRVFRSMLLICVCTAAWTVKAHWLLQKN